MTENNNRRVRQTLSQVVGNIVSPPRVRDAFDTKGFNSEVEDKLAANAEKLLKIKKEGAPDLPDAPKNPGRKVDSKAKARYEADKKNYDEAVKAYNKFSSDHFERVKVRHTLCKHLQSILALLGKKDPTDTVKAELADLQKAVKAGGKPVRRAKESDEDFEKRSQKWQSFGFDKIVGAVNLDDPAAVQSMVNKIKASDEGVQLLLERDAISHNRTRSNDPASVVLATVLDAIIAELADHAIDELARTKKSTLQPDHVVTSRTKNLSLYPLINNLPHYKAVIARQERKIAFENERKAELVKLTRIAKLKAKREGTAVKIPTLKAETFPEREVKNGFAVVKEPKKPKEEQVADDKKGKPRVTYQWYDIDIDREGKSFPVRFDHYVEIIVRRAIDNHLDVGEDVSGIMISNNLKKFLSDLCVDFIHRVEHMANILIVAMKVKTVDAAVVETVIKMFLLDSYDHSSVPTLTESHRRLLDSAHSKAQICTEHQTSVPHKEEETVPEDEDLEDLGHEEDPTGEDGLEASTMDDDLEDISPKTGAASPKANGSPVKAVGSPVRK